jgi:hypothetical protein
MYCSSSYYSYIKLLSPSNNIIMNGLLDALNVSTADPLPERRK